MSKAATQAAAREAAARVAATVAQKAAVETVRAATAEVAKPEAALAELTGLTLVPAVAGLDRAAKALSSALQVTVKWPARAVAATWAAVSSLAVAWVV